MYLPPPIDLTPRLACPFCRQLTPKADTKCVHCDQEIPESFRQREIAAGKLRRQKAKRAALILVPVVLILLTWIFWKLGY
jgi:hypothetical protein